METASFNLRHGLRDSAHRLGLASFWRWWTGELATMTPPALRAALRRRLLRPVLVFDTTVAVLWQPRVIDGDLGYAESARIDLTGDSAAVLQAGRAAIDALPLVANGGPITAPSVLVALTPSKVLRKRIVLPAAVEENLRQTLAYDLDRHTPFRADDLYFDATISERDVARREIVVDWAAARRTDVDAARRMAESFGATVAGVAADAPGRGDPAKIARLDLLPEAERNDTAWWRRWRLWVPAVLVLAIAGIAVLLPIWQKRDYAIALNRQVDDAYQQAQAADALRSQLEQQIADYNFVLAKKYGYASAMQVLDDVTKLLPDDTWLTQLELKTSVKGKDQQRDLLLRGESANAGRLISLLEDSKLFEQAAPRSPTTKIQPGPGEIFDLGAQLKPLSPRSPVDAADGTAAAATPQASASPSSAPASAASTPTPAAAPATAPSAAVAPVPPPAAAAPAANAAAPPPRPQAAPGPVVAAPPGPAPVVAAPAVPAPSAAAGMPTSIPPTPPDATSAAIRKPRGSNP